MKFTDLFVRRPVLALVVSTLLLLMGLRALSGLPIRQYPLTESTTITITTQYPGASPDLMQGFVTQPIAQSVATVEGIDYLSSSSTQGRSVITVRMKLNADSNKAMTEVMAKVNEVKYRLPQDAYDPVLVKSAGEATAVAYVGFSSSTMSLPALTDYLSRVVQPQLSSIDGVASVELYGGQKLAMRVWLDPDRLAARGISAGELAEALRQNNVQAAPGQAKGLYVVSNIKVNTDLVNVAEFRDMVVKREGDAIVRLGDVATVELGAASTDSSGLMDGEPAVYFGLNATPVGNPLVIVKRLNELLPNIKQNLPPGTSVQVPFELARFISASIDGVVHTLMEAIVIVVAVIFLCLGSLRAVLIPVVTIPLSMLGGRGHHGAVRLQREPADAAGHGAGHRPGGGRRHRGGRERAPPYRRRQVASARGADRRARGGRPGHRHDHHAGGGVRADRPDGRPDRFAVQGIRLHAGGGGGGVGRDRADAVAGDELVPAQ